MGLKKGKCEYCEKPNANFNMSSFMNEFPSFDNYRFHQGAALPYGQFCNVECFLRQYEKKIAEKEVAGRS